MKCLYGVGVDMAIDLYNACVGGGLVEIRFATGQLMMALCGAIMRCY